MINLFLYKNNHFIPKVFGIDPLVIGDAEDIFARCIVDEPVVIIFPYILADLIYASITVPKNSENTGTKVLEKDLNQCLKIL